MEYELHSQEPWMIVRSKPNREEQAKDALEREGHEVYYPRAKHLTVDAIPLRMLTGSKRNSRPQPKLIEVIRPAWRGYLFVRRLLGAYDPGRFWELQGVLGLCLFGEDPATLDDYEVEGIRIREARGEFDIADARALRLYHRQGVDRPSLPRIVGRLDKGDHIVLFRETVGRITRVIVSNQDMIPSRG